MTSPTPTKKFTICALFYGDYPDLTVRLLESLGRRDILEHCELRFGLNDVCEATATAVWNHCQAWEKFWGTPWNIWQGHEPYYKYPMMRRMFYEQPLMTDYVMWFDDDSWIKPTAPPDWLRRVENAMTHKGMIGSVWRMHWNKNQRQFAEDQPWYTGKPIAKQVSFCTGGWWTIRRTILERWDWPVPLLEHRGGDVLLGELCNQQGYRIGNFNLHLAINADKSGKCSTSPRRGFDQKPLGHDYKRPDPAAQDWTDTLAGD